MAFYDWRNTETDEVETTDKYDVPPDDSGNWRRIFSFGVGQVSGAANSPARPAPKNKHYG